MFDNNDIVTNIMEMIFETKQGHIGDIQSKANSIVRRMNNYIHKDKLVLNSIRKITEKSKSKTDPYYYCDKYLIEKINKLVESFHEIKLKSNYNEDCCICLDECEFNNRSYFMCKHFVCKTCYYGSNFGSNFGSNNSKCPICRTKIKIKQFSDKYAIICTGTPTQLYTFNNGGYKSICIAYFPEFNGERSTIFTNITYHDDNQNKLSFITTINKLFDSGYVIVLQNYIDVIKWMNEIMLKELAKDKRLIYE